VLLAVALNPGNAAIPCVPLRRIARPPPQLGLDVGGRGDPRGDERQLSPLGENLVGDRQLPARSLSGVGQLAGLGCKTRDRIVGLRLPGVDAGQLVAALAAR
jgi:hypothetical protein